MKVCGMQYHVPMVIDFFIFFLSERMSLMTSKLAPSKNEKRELWFIMGIMILWLVMLYNNIIYMYFPTF